MQFKAGAAIDNLESVMKRFPLPPKKGAKKEDKKAAAAPPEPKVIPPESVAQAYEKSVSWNNAANI